MRRQATGIRASAAPARRRPRGGEVADSETKRMLRLWERCQVITEILKGFRSESLGHPGAPACAASTA